MLAQNGSVSITPIYDDEYLEQNVCPAVVNLAADAAKGFVKAKGKEVETQGNITTWTSNMGVPGTITSSLLFTTSWQYEGVLYQGMSADDWKTAYGKYKRLLGNCLTGKGYDETTEKNVEEGMSSYPEVVYKKPSGDMPTVSLKVEHVSSTGIYTLTINVWQAGR